MKTVTISLALECRDDVPESVMRWMAQSLVTHAETEFGNGYFDPEMFDPRYEGPPLTGDVRFGSDITVTEGM